MGLDEQKRQVGEKEDFLQVELPHLVSELNIVEQDIEVLQYEAEVVHNVGLEQLEVESLVFLLFGGDDQVIDFVYVQYVLKVELERVLSNQGPLVQSLLHLSRRYGLISAGLDFGLGRH